MMDGRLRELLDYFVQSNYNLMVIYNPLCKEATQRIIIYQSYSIPNPNIFNYTVTGRDVTKMIEHLKKNSSIIPHQRDTDLSVQVNSIQPQTYEFSKDYAFELIR